MSSSTKTDFMSIKQATAGPLPPPSYPGLLRAVLRYRQKHVLSLAFAGTFVLLPIATFPVAGLDALLAPFYPTVWLFLAVGWVGTLPILVVRKEFRQVVRPSAPTNYAAYRQLASARQAQFTLLAYLLSSALIVLSYISIVTWLAPNRSYLWLIRTPGRDLLQINERLVYLSLALLSSSTVYAVKQLIEARHVLRFSTNQASIPIRLQTQLAAKAPSILPLALSTNITLLGLYILLRRSVLRFIIYRIPYGRLLRPYLMSMLRHNAITSSLVLSSLALSCSTLVLYELLNSLGDVYFSQAVNVSGYSTEPRKTLLDGLESSDAYTRRFAVLEMRQVALTDQDRRKAIFADIKEKSLERIIKTCLTQLERSYSVLGRRGQPAQSAGGSASAGVSSTRSIASQASGNRIPISSEAPFKPVQRTFLDGVLASASAGIAPQAAPSLAMLSQPTAAIKSVVPEQASTAVSSAIAKVPTILQRAVGDGNAVAKKMEESTALVKSTVGQVENKASEVVQKAVEAKSTLESWVPAQIHQSVPYKHLFAPLLRAQIAASLPEADLDAWAATSLAAMMMASLHEDQYGVAQADIPKVTEALLLYLDAVESYKKEVEAMAEEGKFSREVVQTAVEADILPLAEALRDSVIGILHTFNAYLGDINFPKSIAKRIHDFV